jgi:hypothetical protein
VSKGLGRLQREIIAAETPGAFEVDGLKFELRKDVIDLRRVVTLLAGKHNAYTHCTFVRPSFQAAFSRAVKGLVRRGLIEKLTVVPVAQIDRYYPEAFERLSDGYHYLPPCQQTRYVRRIALPVEGIN